jgi:pimeloyl-ACP methyl ester carboxylesterase
MEVNGKAVAVDIFDGGAPILMIHGLGGTSNVCYAHPDALPRSFRVICPDPEGTGRSPLEGELSIVGFVANIDAMLDPLNSSSVHVVGYSPGTMVCQHLAVNHTASVAGADCGAVTARSARTIRMRAERTNERDGSHCRHFSSDGAIDSNQGHQS